MYKLLQRIDSKIEGEISEGVRDRMYAIIFMKLRDVESLRNLDSFKASEYKKTPDFQKIRQIVDQYQKKYEKEISGEGRWTGYESFQSELAE